MKYVYRMPFLGIAKYMTTKRQDRYFFVIMQWISTELATSSNSKAVCSPGWLETLNVAQAGNTRGSGIIGGSGDTGMRHHT